ncbi:hypothetical protein ACPUYX_05885 [Desulfosporosinus sp. SYSU MS00001]|uniref:hypothetical protein n=1 Tax=Desulfosporosinus sp. SYSU MS00001 TaxID=3416284 RepID=UPI003CEFCE80
MNEKTKATLSSYIDKLFYLDNNGRVLDLPEDICFFREDNTLFLGTNTHCRFAVFYFTDQETQTITLPDGFEEKPEIQVLGCCHRWRPLGNAPNLQAIKSLLHIEINAS